MIGSANMDRRSFDLNYENNILFYDLDLTAAMRQRQLDCIARSSPVTTKMAASWSRHGAFGTTASPRSAVRSLSPGEAEKSLASYVE